MSALNVLVVGGGVGGMSAAIQLARQGAEVELIDIDPDWKVYGAGITITGPTLRAFRTLGVLDEVAQAGFCSHGIRVFTQDGRRLGEVPAPQLEPGIPSQGGIMRPLLHKILSTRTLQAGARVRLGLTVEHIGQDGQGVDVRFSDGGEGRYDLVIGADGAYSKVRDLLFPTAPKPEPTGQGCWRMTTARPPEVDWSEFYAGGKVRAGVTPCSQAQMYLFALMPVGGEDWIDPEVWPDRLREALQGFRGTVAKVRDAIGPDSFINYRPLASAIAPRPWRNGRVALIGDAVHATTPHLASGAGMAVEDAIVLAYELAARPGVEDALDAYEERRFERCRLVVDASRRLGEIELARGSEHEHQALRMTATQALAAPI